jgi:uncharacterized protein (DUF1501 family)
MPTGNFSDTKILVIMFKDGGEDSLHGLIPRSTARLDEIGYPGKSGTNWRPTLGFTPAEVAANTGGHIDANWCLHPSLNPIKAIWDANDLAITHRVGTMFTDISSRSIQDIRRATYRDNTGNILLPSGLGAHDVQQLSMSSMITRDFVDQFGMPRVIAESGFIGRLVQMFSPFTSSLGTPAGPPSTLPIAFAAGNPGTARTLIARSGLVRGLDIPVVTGRYNRMWVNTPQNISFLARIDAINGLPQTEARRNLYRNVAEIMRQSVAFIQPVIEGANGTFTVDADFTVGIGTGWQGILRTFARAIAQRTTGLGLPRRMVFIGNVGSYDTHSEQGKTTGTLPSFFADEAAALVDFREAMIRLGVWNETLVTDWSEFSRTLLENGSRGTDHAWARTCKTMGGAVIPGHYGSPPTSYGITTYDSSGATVTAGGSHDVNGGELGGGSLAPAISAEQYWGRILEWFGADSADLNVALPRRASFGSPVGLI